MPTTIIREKEGLLSRWLSRSLWLLTVLGGFWLGIVISPAINAAMRQAITPARLQNPNTASVNQAEVSALRDRIAELESGLEAAKRDFNHGDGLIWAEIKNLESRFADSASPDADRPRFDNNESLPVYNLRPFGD